MPTVKTQNGKVVTKDGKVSCECCQDNCYTDLANEFDPPATTGEWTNLSPASYANILAGGDWSISNLNIDISWDFILTFPEGASTIYTLECDLSDIPIGNHPANQCLYTATSQAFTVNRTANGYFYTNQADTIERQWPFRVGLGTDGNARKINLTHILLGFSIWLPIFPNTSTSIRSVVPIIGNHTAATAYSSSFSGFKGTMDATFAASATIGPDVIIAPTSYITRWGLSASLELNPVTGSMAVDFVFSPSAP